MKKLKLNTLEKIKTLQDNIFIKIDVNNLKEINQILNTIINKQVAVLDESNSFSSKEVIERQNSEDSGITSKTKQSNNSTDSLNFSIDEDDKDYSWIDVSNCNKNSHKRDKLSRSASLSLIS